jgi:hypothetical protein
METSLVRRTTFLMIVLILATGCRKDGSLFGKREAATLDTPLSLQLDTNCLRAPNVITANGDGLNDVFQLTYNEPLLSLSVHITNPAGTTVYSSSSFTPAWNGADAEFLNEPGPVPYLYTVHLTTLLGTELSATKVLHVVRDLTAECISASVPPLTGERLDPRLCNDLWEQMDQICVE